MGQQNIRPARFRSQGATLASRSFRDPSIVPRVVVVLSKVGRRAGTLEHAAEGCRRRFNIRDVDAFAAVIRYESLSKAVHGVPPPERLCPS